MDVGYDQLNFEGVNSNKIFSPQMKVLALFLSLLFILLPLYDISPETFPIIEKFEIISCFVGYR